VIPSEFEGDSAKLRGYAAEHSMVVAAANYGSATGGLAAAGRSSIWAANGDLLVRLGGAGAGVTIATEHAGGWRTKVIRGRLHGADQRSALDYLQQQR